jgi:hypothetical protein
MTICPRLLRPTVRALALAAAATVTTSALACGYHDPSSVALGMLNLAYPESLHVRTAVWMAQLDGVLTRTELAAGGSARSSDDLFQQSLRYRETLARLGALRERIDSALRGEPMPAFSIVLIGPMLWTRFERTDGALNMVAHAIGPASEDVVIVSDAPVVAALVEGQITPQEARGRGLVRLYGSRESVEQVSALLDRLGPLEKERLSQSHQSVEAN